MSIVKKVLAISITLIVMLIAVFLTILPSPLLPKVVNKLLPAQWQVVMPENVAVGWFNLQLPTLTLLANSGSNSCSILTLQDVQFDLHPFSLTVAKVKVDYACFTQQSDVEKSEKQNAFSMSEGQKTLALLPDFQLIIQQLNVINHQQALYNERVSALLDASWQINLQYQQQHISLKTTALSMADKNFSNLHLTGNLSINERQYPIQLSANYQYQQEQHHLYATATLTEPLDTLLVQANLRYQWQGGVSELEKGQVDLQWQQNEGVLSLTDLANNETLVTLPFILEDKTLSTKEAQINWTLWNAQGEISQKLKGLLNFNLTFADFNHFFPAQASMRLAVVSEGELGKGTLVIRGENLQLDQQKLNVALRINGDFKYQDSVAYVNFPILIDGTIHTPTLRFQSGSLLRVVSKNPYFDIDELRFPLAGVSVNQYGVNGRLQGIIRGRSLHHLSQVKLHLDGMAKEFVAGIYSVFNVRPLQNTKILKSAVNQEEMTNCWQWRFWGGGTVDAFNIPLTVSGRGVWHNDEIEVVQLKGELPKIVTDNVTLPSLQFSLTQPLLWQYQQEKLTGEALLQSAWLQFSYGGKLIKPQFLLQLNGTTPQDLRLNGILSTDKLGLKLFARYQNGGISGKAYWAEQAAAGFQSLFPQDWEWLIKRGSVRGETAFSYNADNGVLAGGHFSIKQADVLLPNGEIKGIDFALPYRFSNNKIQFGISQPISVSVQNIKNGLIHLDNLKVKVSGSYPYSIATPLNLTQLSVDLFDGQLQVTKFSLPQKKAAHLSLYNLNAAKISEVLQYNQVGVLGRIDANFPFWLENDCLICEGIIKPHNGLSISLDSQLKKQLQQNGITEYILADLLGNIDIKSSQVKINLLKDGKLTLIANIHSLNPNRPNQPMILNYHHQENMFDLWRSLNFGSTLEQNLEYQLN